MAMEESVSEIKESSTIDKSYTNDRIDLYYELRMQYRFLRKKISTLIRKQLKKNFINILYITTEQIPAEYIVALQKQYPDKIVKVLIPLFAEPDNSDKLITVDYFMQNKKHNATVFHLKPRYDNIQVYGVYTEVFSDIKNKKDIYNIKYISHYAKIARKAALKIKPDLIHAENIPFFAGLELGSRWISGYAIKVIQFIHDFSLYSDIEPFWAAINLANKKELQKICSDKVIINTLGDLFNIEKSKRYKKTKACINYILKKYDEYRENVTIDDETRENSLLIRVNKRIKKLFPNIVPKKETLYNPMYYSFKYANEKVINSITNNKPSWIQNEKDYHNIIVKSENKNEKIKLKHHFDSSEFRNIRPLNKKYLLRELSKKRIEMNFLDTSLFNEQDVKIHGYLDYFFNTPLIFIIFNEYANLHDIKTASLAILKAFELRKNIQVIYNFPKDIKCNYFNMLIDFFESQSALNGKWVTLEGKINLPQFMSSSDMLMIPSGNCLNIENILYTGLRFGCIPIVSENGSVGNIVSDIFDDMNTGCGFKKGNIHEENISDYESVFLKALDFYSHNTSWNLIIKNAINYNTNWDFETIEKYNSLYEEII